MEGRGYESKQSWRSSEEGLDMEVKNDMSKIAMERAV